MTDPGFSNWGMGEGSTVTKGEDIAYFFLLHATLPIQDYQCRTFDHLGGRGGGLQVFRFTFVYIEITSRSQLGENLICLSVCMRT